MEALRRTTLLFLLAAGTLLAACGDDGDDTVTTAPPPPQQNGTAEPPPVGSGEGGVTLTQLGEFSEPLYVAQPPGEDRDIYVVERGGTIQVIRNGEVLPRPFLDITDVVGSEDLEQGLLSVAFAPDYQRSGRFYVDYTNKAGDTRVVEYRRSSDDPPSADPGSARELLGVDQPFSNHNGGLLLFGPDGNLYIGLGDGGDAGDPDRNGQDLSTLLGKILRIDPLPQGGRPYGIPTDNPFVGREGARPEIFIYGARNPWRFSFDPDTGALVIADVGQDEFEEVDYLPRGEQAGANLGWSAFEGEARFNDDQTAPGAVRPILTYGREGGCSITGGYVVRDPALTSLYGRYVYGDYCLGELHSFIPSATQAKDDKALGESVSGLSSFGVDNAGHVYATSLEGPVYRIDPG
jgi:glucose/arabinose dehydrogenase